jgi:hypothetical protein
MCLEHSDGFPGLHEQRFVVFEISQTMNDCIVAFPIAGGFSGPSVDYKILGFFGNLGIEVVHQHPKGCFLQPTFARKLIATRGDDDSFPIYRLHTIGLVTWRTD